MPLSYILACLFLFGLIVGSFLNVVILRYGTGMRISKGRSKCFACDKTLSWYELLPVASFAMQKGRCRGCSTRISWQYPLVELLTALALPIAYLYSPSAFSPLVNAGAFILLAILLCFYVVIAVYDMRLKIIPDFFSYGAAVVALLSIALQSYALGGIDFTQVVAGPILYGFFAFFWVISKGKWMGLGDAKLALSIGWFLGLSAGIAAILFAFWIGAVLSLGLIFLQRLNVAKGRLGMKSEIPFGPFILIGFLVAFLAQLDFASILSILAR